MRFDLCCCIMLKIILYHILNIYLWFPTITVDCGPNKINTKLRFMLTLNGSRQSGKKNSIFITCLATRKLNWFPREITTAVRIKFLIHIFASPGLERNSQANFRSHFEVFSVRRTEKRLEMKKPELLQSRKPWFNKRHAETKFQQDFPLLLLKFVNSILYLY